MRNYWIGLAAMALAVGCADSAPAPGAAKPAADAGVTAPAKKAEGEKAPAAAVATTVVKVEGMS